MTLCIDTDGDLAAKAGLRLDLDSLTRVIAGDGLEGLNHRVR